MDSIPLAERLRPTSFTNFVGQNELVGKDGIIRKLLASALSTGFFPSLIFWGPPGSGKTTLARIIAKKLDREFFEFSAVNTSTKEIAKIMPHQPGNLSESRHNSLFQIHDSGKQPVVFLDEIHRFNKAQQDKLLPHIERGEIILIGATTENPSFEVISPLLSRSRVIILNRLSEIDLSKLITRSSKLLDIKLNKDAKEYLVEASNGDARVLLTVLDIASHIDNSKVITLKSIEDALQKKQLSFDKLGDEYYNTISSYLKSMRASNVDASLYYLARMVEAGQDPLYIARRMIVFASEDVASPTALVVANAVFRACETVGYPECQENLAAGTVYLATAAKDRSAYDAYMKALDDVKKFGNLPTPMKIRNAPTKLMKELGYGKGYEPYTNEDLLPDKIKGRKYYNQKNEKD